MAPVGIFLPGAGHVLEMLFPPEIFQIDEHDFGRALRQKAEARFQHVFNVMATSIEKPMPLKKSNEGLSPSSALPALGFPPDGTADAQLDAHVNVRSSPG